MRPSLITDEQIPIGARRVTVMPPGNTLDSRVSPVEAVAYRSNEIGVNVIAVRCIPEEGDLAKLANGEGLWLMFYEHIPPFAVAVLP